MTQDRATSRHDDTRLEPSNFYQIVAGKNPSDAHLLSLIGLTEQDVPRFRDVGFDEAENRLDVLTRVGGGNYRHAYEDSAECANCDCDYCRLRYGLETRPDYVMGEDYEFDTTYRMLSFRLPDDWRERLQALEGTP